MSGSLPPRGFGMTDRLRRFSAIFLVAVMVMAGGAVLRADRTSEATGAESLLVELCFESPSGVERVIRVDQRGVLSIPDLSLSSGPWRAVAQLPEEHLIRLREELSSLALGSIDSEVLASRVELRCRETGVSEHVANAPISCLRVQTASGVHELQCHALSLMAVRFPEEEPLQRLNAAQQRMLNLLAVVQVGGPEAAQGLADRINRMLAREHPDLPPVRADELSMVRELSTGSRCFQFVQPLQQAQARRLICLFEMVGAEPVLRVLEQPALAE